MEAFECSPRNLAAYLEKLHNHFMKLPQLKLTAWLIQQTSPYYVWFILNIAGTAFEMFPL